MRAIISGLLLEIGTFSESELEQIDKELPTFKEQEDEYKKAAGLWLRVSVALFYCSYGLFRVRNASHRNKTSISKFMWKQHVFQYQQKRRKWKSDRLR